MAILGWFVVLGLAVFCSLLFLLLCTQTLGKYNIGGVPTTLKDKSLTIFLGAVLIVGWIIVFKLSPFTVTVSG